jgi:hypothetical protein
MSTLQIPSPCKGEVEPRGGEGGGQHRIRWNDPSPDRTNAIRPSLFKGGREL